MNIESIQTGRHKFKKFYTNPAFLPISLILFATGVLLIFALKNIYNAETKTSNNSDNLIQQTSIDKPLKTQKLNKSFTFPLKDDTGKTLSPLKFTLEDIELRTEIIVKGQKAEAVSGRAFLIVNLKIANDYDKSVQINARDYFRLSVNNSDEKLAPEIHNDPVEVQAISTKYTRIGFPINITDKNLTLYVGEITGKKDTIKLNLR